MKRLILSVILLVSLLRLAGADVVATAKIVDVGRTREGHEAFVVQADVRNQSSAPVIIFMMTCSWGDSWRIEPKKSFAIPIWACDSNFPTSYTFPAGGGFSFRFLVESSEATTKAEGKRFKLGFVCSKAAADIWKPAEERYASAATVWTKELIVPEGSDRVLAIAEERKELPNQTSEPTAPSGRGSP